MAQDIRWVQRFDNFTRALETLQRAVALAGERDLSELELQGLIQGFEITHELAWNVLKDYLEHQGITGLIGSRDAVRRAFQNGLIEEGDVWMDMIKDRNLSSHTYQQALAEQIAKNVLNRFYPAFKALHTRMLALHDVDAD